jgi:hypothetical protein
MQCYPTSLLGPNILLSTLFSHTSICVLPLVWETKFHTHTKRQVRLLCKYETCRNKILNWMVIAAHQHHFSVITHKTATWNFIAVKTSNVATESNFTFSLPFQNIWNLLHIEGSASHRLHVMISSSIMVTRHNHILSFFGVYFYTNSNK